jgi:hypothetical protein
LSRRARRLRATCPATQPGVADRSRNNRGTAAAHLDLERPAEVDVAREHDRRPLRALERTQQPFEVARIRPEVVVGGDEGEERSPGLEPERLADHKADRNTVQKWRRFLGR